MSFGDNLKKLRKAKGLSQQELGKIFGLSDRTIGHYEANKRFPKSAQLLMSIARYFEIPIEHLLDYEAPLSVTISYTVFFYKQQRYLRFCR